MFLRAMHQSKPQKSVEGKWKLKASRTYTILPEEPITIDLGISLIPWEEQEVQLEETLIKGITCKLQDKSKKGDKFRIEATNETTEPVVVNKGELIIEISIKNKN